MRVVILQDAEQVSSRAADIICSTLSAKPNSVLGLATGGTPLSTYQKLVQRYEAGQASFGEATSFNLDEYVGLPPDHEQSYHAFMHTHLFGQTDFDSQRCFLPDGCAENQAEACERYEQMIDEAGGIDLQLLGVGTDGHIAFNEPGSSLASRTRLKALTQQTRSDNARFFDSIDQVPRLSITVGIGTILDAERILLLATGQGKASAVRALVEGPVTSQVPASALQLHPDVTILLDEDAASWLVRTDYYRQVELVQRELEGFSNA